MLFLMGDWAKKSNFERKTSGLGKKVTKKSPGCKSADNIFHNVEVMWIQTGATGLRHSKLDNTIFFFTIYTV
jgi:hypothetical protein